MRTISLLTVISLIALSFSVHAGEFGNQCTLGLAMSKNVDTDCKISWSDKDGKTYCFGNDDARQVFLKDPEGNLKKAQDYYATNQKK